jgi:cytoskeletal protein RodZ
VGDLDPSDPVRDAISDLATRSARPAGAVLEDLRPAMGRARLHRRLHLASMTAAAAALIVVGGISLRSPTEAQQVQIADETSGPEEILPVPETSELTSRTTVTPPTTVAPTTTVEPTATSVVVPTTEAAPAPSADPDPTIPAWPSPMPVSTTVPAVATPPAPPSTSPPAVPPPSGSSQTVVIQVPGAGTITVRHTPTAITQVDVTTTGGYTHEIEDRTVHEVKVEFEGGGPKIEVEVHLEDGEITYQIDGDGSGD